MINYCIDETLIKQGVDQITLDESRMSAPTIIERICAIVESLLDYHYATACDRVFDVVSTMFHKLGSNSPYFMRGILKNLEDMQKLPDEDFPFRKQLSDKDSFLSYLPLAHIFDRDFAASISASSSPCKISSKNTKTFS